MTDLLVLTIGLLLLAKGGDMFVDSSVQIARRFHIPAIVIGGTIVSLATTSPELIVSVTASVMKDPGIALGNAVGSAIANIGLIVGLTLLIRPVQVNVSDFRRRSGWMIISALLVIAFSWSLVIRRFEGFILLGLGFAYLSYDIFWRVKHRANSSENAVESETSSGKSIALFAIGFILVIIGSQLIVTRGILIAEKLGIPSVIIGLTVVAVGTSVPELVTALISSRKGIAELSVGNILGANVLNLALITGLSAVICPLTLTSQTRAYSFTFLIIMIGLMIGSFWKNGKASRIHGFIILLAYLIYVSGLIYSAVSHA